MEAWRLPNLIIIGSGPAGLTAAIYAARGGLHVKVVEGTTLGGQLMLTSEVENYPGFPEPIMGPDLMTLMRKQAERFGVEFIPGEATGAGFAGRPLKVRVNKTVYEADVVIAATGASSRWLGLKSEQRLRGKGVSSCATCDGRNTVATVATRRYRHYVATVAIMRGNPEFLSGKAWLP